jgi:hypothetical protein
MEGCHELVGGVGSIQQIWLHDLPWYECGRTLSMNMHQEEIYQWGLLVGIPRIVEMGHGQYIYDEHMEESHSVCVPLKYFRPTSIG